MKIFLYSSSVYSCHFFLISSASVRSLPFLSFIQPIIQVFVLTSNAEKAEAEWFYEDLQGLLEQTPPKGVLFIIGDWNAKVGIQEIPGLTGKFGFGVQNEAGKSFIEFFQQNTLVIGHQVVNTKIILIIFFATK